MWSAVAVTWTNVCEELTEAIPPAYLPDRYRLPDRRQEVLA
ncbi:hypothetical protein AB0K93_04985 [Streptomyces sp. NPDC052676]